MDLLKHVLSISKQAYEQEVKRSEIIASKMEYLFKWLTIIFGALNVVFPIVMKELPDIAGKDKCVTWYIVVMSILVADIIVIIILSLPRKIKVYPLGTDILEKIQKEPDRYMTENECIKNQIFRIDAMTKKLSKNNDGAVRWLRLADFLMGLAMISMGILFITVMKGI